MRLTEKLLRGGGGRLVERLRDRMRFAGSDVRCPCCEGRFGRFRLTEGGPLELECPRCGSRPRQRLLWLFLTAERLLATRGLRILHLAPERAIERGVRVVEGGGDGTGGGAHPPGGGRAGGDPPPLPGGPV